MPDTTLNLFGEEVPIPADLKPMSGLSPVEQMRRMYGERRGFTCGSCKHLTRHGKGTSWFKCAKFGVTNSTATDWRSKWAACGLFEDLAS
jgi:hypothetical protein